MLSVCYKNIITLSRTASTMHFAQKSGFKFVHYSGLHTAITMRYDKGTTKQHKPIQIQEENTMRKFKITAANKKHFDSLILDFRNQGFMLVTYGKRLAELETETEFVIIEY